MSALGYVDEVIRHIDSGKKIFWVVGKNREESLSYKKVPRDIINLLVTSTKFTLPTLGHFYRPLEDLHAKENGKFDLYAQDYELEMMRYPPYDSFVLEFKGFDEKVFIRNKSGNEDVVFSKYVLLCRQLYPDTISLYPFYYNTRAIDIFPEGWATNGVHLTIHYDPPERRLAATRSRQGGYSLRVSMEELDPWTQHQAAMVSTGMVPELRALLQFFVVINVRKGVVRSQAQTPKKQVALTGRRLGYTYHVLNIDPAYVAPESQNLGGTHASPRFHIRRAHLRHYQDGTFTFVRQTTVGNPLLGQVDKDYKIE